jgi:hypothetical protein
VVVVVVAIPTIDHVIFIWPGSTGNSNPQISTLAESNSVTSI